MSTEFLGSDVKRSSWYKNLPRGWKFRGTTKSRLSASKLVAAAKFHNAHIPAPNRHRHHNQNRNQPRLSPQEVGFLRRMWRWISGANRSANNRESDTEGIVSGLRAGIVQIRERIQRRTRERRERRETRQNAHTDITSASFRKHLSASDSHLIQLEEKMKKECRNQESVITIMPFDEDDLKEGLVVIKLPGQDMGECYTYDNIKQYWLSYVRSDSLIYEWSGPNVRQLQPTKPLFKLPISGVWIDFKAVENLKNKGIIRLKKKFPRPTYIGARRHFISSIFGVQEQIYTT